MKDKIVFTADGAPGTHRILAFVTTRPLKFGAVPVPQKQDTGQKQEFVINPTTKNQVKSFLKETARGAGKVEKDKLPAPGVDVEQLPFEFAMADALFVIQVAGKPKPVQKDNPKPDQKNEKELLKP